MEQSTLPPKQFAFPNRSGEDIDLKQIFSVLTADWLWLLIGATVGLILSFCITLTTIPLYQSTALIQINDEVSSGSVLNSLSSMGGMISKASPTQVQTALIHSRYILDPVTESMRLNLKATPSYFPLIGKTISRRHKGNDLAKPWLGLDHYGWGGEKIKLSELTIPKTGSSAPLVIVAQNPGNYALYNDDDQQILTGSVGKLATTTLPEYKNLSILVSQLTANPGTHFAVSKTPTTDYATDLSGHLDIKDQGDYGNNNRETGVLQVALTWPKPEQATDILNKIINTAQQKDIQKKSQQAAQALHFIKTQLPKVRIDLNKSEEQLNNYRSQSNILDISAESKMMLTQLVQSQNALEQLKLEKTQLQQGFTNKHPVIITINEKIARQQQALNALEVEAKKLPHSDQKALSLMREVKVKETLYSSLLSKIQELSVLQAGTTGDITILNDATAPLNPLPTHKRFIVLAGTMAGFILVAMAILLNHLLLSGEMDPETIEQALDIPVNAVVPYSREQEAISKEAEKNNTTQPILSRHHSTDPAVESMRSLRTSLQLHLTQSRNNIISVLGPSPSVGKSFITLNLASVLAESQQRVLVIDTDIRKGKCHAYVDGARYPGLTEYLQNKSPIESIIRPIDAYCDIIVAGRYPKNPTELLSHSRFAELLQWAQNQYNLVVLDTSPIMAVTDALLVAKHSGINLMLIGLGKNNIKELQATIKRCHHNQIKIDGAVCNYFSKKVQSYSYSKYGYYYYSYGDKT